MKINFLIGLCGASGAVSVILGALSAHALKESLPAASLSALETGVYYQFIHTLSLLAVALASLIKPELLKLFTPTVYCWLLGIVLFSGSLYALAFGAPSFFGPITPLGGLCFIAGWCWLTFAARSIKSAV